MGLFERLMGEESEGKPPIGLHGFNSSLVEFARHDGGGTGLTKGQVATNYDIDGQDAEAQALLGLIEDETGLDAKIAMARALGEVFIISEGQDSNALYPDKAAIKTRFGL